MEEGTRKREENVGEQRQEGRNNEDGDTKKNKKGRERRTRKREEKVQEQMQEGTRNRETKHKNNEKKTRKEKRNNKEEAALSGDWPPPALRYGRCLVNTVIGPPGGRPIEVQKR